MGMPDDGFIRESCLTEPDNARDDLDRSCSHHNGFGYGPLICCGGWCRASFLGAFRDDLEPMPMPDDGFIRESCLTEPDNARDDLDRSCSHHNGFGYGPLICCDGWCRTKSGHRRHSNLNHFLSSIM